MSLALLANQGNLRGRVVAPPRLFSSPASRCRLIAHTKKHPRGVFFGVVASKPDSVVPGLNRNDDNLSRPVIARRLERLSYLLLRKDGHGLAPRKDLAVSFSLFCPYGEIKPTSLGLGSPRSLRIGTSLLAPLSYERQLLTATFLTLLNFASKTLGGKGVRTFLSL